MKKIILSILFIAFVFAAIGQNLKGYNVEALQKLEAKRAFVIDLDTFYATTQLSSTDTILTSKDYVDSRSPYPGVINEPTITKNIDGTISIASDGDYIFNEQADGKGRNVVIENVSGVSLNITDDAVSYVYVDYNNGSPFYTFGSDNAIFFLDFTKLPVVRVTRLGTQLHFEELGEFAAQLANKIMYKNVAVNPFQRQSGLTLSTTATRISTISSGIAWFAIKYYSLTSNVAGSSGVLYQYYLSGGNWLSSSVTSYDADYYSDGTNRQTLSNNKWVAKYFYRDVGDDNEAYYIHGNQYNTQAEALAETLPFAPNIITAHSIYVGKIVIQKGGTNGTAYTRQWEGAIQSATSLNHADQTNLGWTVSNHSDGANKIAAFDATGAATTLDTITNIASQYDLVEKVTGPASSTDNAIARFDGTTGKLIQNSGVILNDSNIIANATLRNKIFISDLNVFLKPYYTGMGLYYDTYTNGALNKPITVNNANGLLTLVTHDVAAGTYGHQLAFVDNGNIYSRKLTFNTSYSAWNTLWTSGNSNLSTINWAANNITAAGYLSAQSSSTSSRFGDFVSNNNMFLSNNLYHDGANWNLDNVSFQGFLLNAGPSDFFRIRYASPGTNPRTLTDVLTLTNTGNLTTIGALQGTTAKLTNLTDNFLSIHQSDAVGLINSNVFQTGNKLRYNTTLTTFDNDNDIPNVWFVNQIAAGNMPKLPVDAATTGNITLSGTQTIDGYSAVVGSRILVWKQTTSSQNGVYIVAAGAWTRATDLDTWAELYKAYVTVLNGAQSGSSFVCTVPSTGTLGTDPVTWILYNAPTNITVSSPLAKSGNTISLGYDTNTLDVASNLLKVKDNVFQPLTTVLTNTTASFTTALETKLNGIEDGAEVNVNADWSAVSGDSQILNKPTLLSQFTNDLGNYGGFLTTETDPIFAADSAKILHWSDTLNITKGISSQYDLTTGLATKQNTLTTGNLTENVTGLQFDATRQVVGGDAQLSLTSGYIIPTTTEQTNWNTAYIHSQNDTDLSPANEIQSAISMGGLRVDASNNYGLWAGNTSALTPTTSYYIFGSSGLGSTDAGTFTVQQLINTIPNATTSIKGLASFNSGNFSVSSGAVSITNSGHSHNAATAPGTYTALVSNGGLGASGGSLYLSNVNATGTAPLLTDYMWAAPSSSTTVKSFTLQTLKDLIGTSSYTLPLAANGTRGGIQIGYTSTANNFALQLSSEKAYTALPDATTSVKGIASFNSGNFSVSSGAVSIATGGIGAMNLANAVISGQVDIGADIVDTDEFLISDAGTLRRTDASRLKTYIGAGFADPMTTVGDIIFRNSSNVTTRLPIGTGDYVLKSYMGTPSWQPIMSGTTTGAIPFNNGSGSLSNDGAAFTYNTSTNTLDADVVTVDTEVYDPTGWNGDLSVPTKDAVRDKIETMQTSYDTYYDNNIIVLNAGVNNYINIFTSPASTANTIYAIVDIHVDYGNNTYTHSSGNFSSYFNGVSIVKQNWSESYHDFLTTDVSIIPEIVDNGTTSTFRIKLNSSVGSTYHYVVSVKFLHKL